MPSKSSSKEKLDARDVLLFLFTRPVHLKIKRCVRYLVTRVFYWIRNNKRIKIAPVQPFLSLKNGRSSYTSWHVTADLSRPFAVEFTSCFGSEQLRVHRINLPAIGRPFPSKGKARKIPLESSSSYILFNYLAYVRHFLFCFCFLQIAN